MERTANVADIFPRLLDAVRATLASFLGRSAAVELYAVYVPGQGITGEYITIDQAETARQRLPYTQRQRAMIYDMDGNALTR